MCLVVLFEKSVKQGIQKGKSKKLTTIRASSTQAEATTSSKELKIIKRIDR